MIWRLALRVSFSAIAGVGNQWRAFFASRGRRKTSPRCLNVDSGRVCCQAFGAESGRPEAIIESSQWRREKNRRKDCDQEAEGSDPRAEVVDGFLKALVEGNNRLPVEPF